MHGLSLGAYLQCIISIILGVVLAIVGGFDSLIQNLLLLMVLDILTGMVVAAMGKSQNSSNGFYSSTIFTKGLFKKILILIIILISHSMDNIFHVDCLRNMTTIFFTINEAISILENAHCAGLPLPNKLVIMLEVYHEQFKSNANENDGKDSEGKSILKDIVHTKNKMNPDIVKKEEEDVEKDYFKREQK